VGSFPGLSGETRPEPSLVETDDGWAFALLVEREPSGFCTVFLPDSPTLTSGSVRIVEATRVRPLEAPMLNLVACLTRSGTGAGALAGHALGDRRAVAGIEGTMTEMVSEGGEPEAQDSAK
jgi:hypothetical protein